MTDDNLTINISIPDPVLNGIAWEVTCGETSVQAVRNDLTTRLDGPWIVQIDKTIKATKISDPEAAIEIAKKIAISSERIRVIQQETARLIRETGKI